MAPKPIPLSEVYRLLEPGPVVLLTTCHKGKANVMTMSWHTMLEFEPPLIGCVISDRNYSFAILKKTKECVINIPSVALAAKVVGCGNTSGRDTDKFQRFGLNRLPASSVQAPLLPDCYASLECRVVDTAMVRKYCFFVLQVTHAWRHFRPARLKTIHHMGRGLFMVAGDTIKLRSRMK